MMLLAAWLGVLLTILGSEGSKTIPELKREILDQILPKNENEILIAPGNFTKDFTIVEASLYVISIDDINESRGEITLRMYFRQYWKDYRLKYPASDQFEYVLINNEDLIWLPDTFFVNEVRSRSFDALRPNVLIKIFPDGSVLYSKRLSATIKCPMDFYYYPFDRQVCKLRLESYASTADHLQLKWRAENPPIGIYSMSPVPAFSLEKFSSSYGMIDLRKKIYSFLTVDFQFSRNLSYSVYNIFLPSIAMVAVSWLPFWMHRKTITGRLLISVSAFLSFTMILCRFSEKQPQSQSSSSMLCFTGTCASFLIVSTVLSVVIHIFDRKEESPYKIVENGELGKTKEEKLTLKTLIKGLPRRRPSFDFASRLIVPSLFTIFCAVYFVVNCLR